MITASNLLKRCKSIKESKNKSSNVNESLAEELKALKIEFKRVLNTMKGTSIHPKDVWITLGIDLGLVTEKQADFLD